MTNEIKFSYIFQNKDTGLFIEKIFDYLDVYNGTAKTFVESLPRHVFVAKRLFTGLRDKNSVEIYEGDILNYQPVHDMPTLGGEVVYDNKTGVWRLKGQHSLLGLFAWLDGEVIGNIYENKSLLVKPDNEAR